MTTVRELEPTSLWNHFADLNAVPRPSKKEERVIQFMKDFGESLGLETQVDPIGNVIIRKPASDGRADRTPTILQAHLDMVHQKNNDTDFDFLTQGIDMFVEDDWVRARGTTLGSDNGIGVASIMALLASTDIPHPPLEGLFTIDEETGMTGAAELAGGLLHGKYLLNLDTEDDDEITIGCAGGVDVSAHATYQPEAPPAEHTAVQLIVRGLVGGHSGVDIHLGRGNANKLMNRLLWTASQQFAIRIHRLDGGGLRNAIPRESNATVFLPTNQIEKWETWLSAQVTDIGAEYATTDPDIEVVWHSMEAADTPDEIIPVELQSRLLAAIYACPNGVYRMSPDIDRLVQTSNNLARVLVENGKLELYCLTRSSVNTERDDLANAICACFELIGAGAEAKPHGSYPGWQPLPDSDLVKLTSALYEERFGESAKVTAIHAGLECGILGRNYPDVQMVSFGPNIRGAHSPDERCQISSVQKYWGYLLALLDRI